MEDEIIAQFIAFTSAPAERARQYLKLSDNDIEQAIELYFSSGGVDLEGPASSIPAPSLSEQPQIHIPNPPRGFQSGEVVDLESDEERSGSDTPQITGHTTRQRPVVSNAATPALNHTTDDDDEAMARRLQEEVYAGGDMNAGVDAEGYRAPIARTRETLVGPASYDLTDSGDLEEAVMEQLQRRRERQTTRQPRTGIFNQQPVASSIWNNTDLESELRERRVALAQATAGASEASSKSSMLAEMYRPPFEIMSRLPWEEARTEGKEKEKWVLVNVQDSAIFDCQVLNRDLWKNPGIKETIQENFIFMQYSKDDPRGSQYIQYYFQARESEDSYPHIAIVDPRTGEQVKVWSGSPSPKPMDFLMQLHEFLDRYSLNVSAKNPVAKRKPEPKISKTVETMTEDEMMEMALQQSLAAGASGPKDDDPDDLTRSMGNDGKGKTNETDDAEMTDVEGTAINGHHKSSNLVSSPFTLISSSNTHSEPAPDAASTRIQFKHSNGRVVRRFSLSDPVRRLYEWLKASPLEGKEGVPFELISMQKNLIECLDLSIEEAALKNGTVMVEFVEAE